MWLTTFDDRWPFFLRTAHFRIVRIPKCHRVTIFYRTFLEFRHGLDLRSFWNEVAWQRTGASPRRDIMKRGEAVWSETSSRRGFLRASAVAAPGRVATPVAGRPARGNSGTGPVDFSNALAKRSPISKVDDTVGHRLPDQGPHGLLLKLGRPARERRRPRMAYIVGGRLHHSFAHMGSRRSSPPRTQLSTAPDTTLASTRRRGGL
jgi:hypothetical protein